MQGEINPDLIIHLVALRLRFILSKKVLTLTKFSCILQAKWIKKTFWRI